MNLSVIFYHPKNPQNLHDVAALAASLRARLYVVPRPGVDYKLEMLQGRLRSRLVMVGSLAEAVDRIGDANYIVLETYGNKYLHEVKMEGDSIVLVIGAEDYGIPPSLLEALKRPVTVAKIPTAVQGMSYNVAASLAMALYEVYRRLRAGSP
ncbi:hypothetical protein CF15_04045 [Pyrodictium occultum]|uniref:tRNA/rRNA methyltransferase SpoU type domain-containing protein n=1 Tax=Pyrodictium occultum TaxID=2309 RepID=A0A0V8RV98_PYROC|nr:TrmH family RNA methyltransferase [Pyrodictium occultum]KSW11972.1 hypothetical protein CF15_04045 [Pyrodictium occultum]